MNSDMQDPQEPEAGATEEAVALHGVRAREEQHEQPEAVALDSDTLIAKDEDQESDRRL